MDGPASYRSLACNDSPIISSNTRLILVLLVGMFLASAIALTLTKDNVSAPSQTAALTLDTPLEPEGSVQAAG
jgi:hypothetical protein